MFFHQIENSQGRYAYNARYYKRVHWMPHFHKSYEALYVAEGLFEIIVDGKRAVLQPGDFALCLSNQVHSHRVIENARYWVGVFSSDYVQEFEKALKGRIGTNFHFRCEGSILAFLQEHLMLDKTEPAPDLHLRIAGLNLLCGEYLRNNELIERNNTEFALMNDICDYISNNYREKLTLKDVAEALGYDYYYFSRLFSRIFGIRFIDYLNACRLSTAMDALRNTDNSITSIALDSGFQSIRSFNDVFLKNTGMSPAQYRKK